MLDCGTAEMVYFQTTTFTHDLIDEVANGKEQMHWGDLVVQRRSECQDQSGTRWDRKKKGGRHPCYEAVSLGSIAADRRSRLRSAQLDQSNGSSNPK